ncbi:hypothetical protein FOVG_12318 [Fusarium oxysporum f. sp. pisi HDV247]|uniref:Uncharacterized protein n=1 Tax=Fusarium oxysporum f. sp. pisi HDV247 TaxID=1080344 RepID=W9P2J7_FUSOX|nr:hypothetical protein FOVG_12318 [Fusarium oxysporum f. sp. pisi HDV247]
MGPSLSKERFTWHWSGPTAGGYRRVMITVRNQVRIHLSILTSDH